jgi:hypothetical protein
MHYNVLLVYPKWKELYPLDPPLMILVFNILQIA